MKDNKYLVLFFITFVGVFVILTFVKLLLKFQDDPGNNELSAAKGMVFVPEGSFVFGANDARNKTFVKELGTKDGNFFQNEEPEMTVRIKGFYIDTYEVTNSKYKVFMKKTAYPPPKHWNIKYGDIEKDDYPVRGVSWYDAKKYCEWADKRLPSELEWEKAARGPNGNVYPWGNLFDINNGNFDKGDTAPVGSFAKDKSFYGVFDMAGNVMEWTSSWYKQYPGAKFKSKDYGERFKVLKGGTGTSLGHYTMPKIFSRSSYRHYDDPMSETIDTGFRCAKS